MPHLQSDDKPCSTKKEEDILAIVLVQLRCPFTVSMTLKSLKFEAFFLFISSSQLCMCIILEGEKP